VSGQQHGSFPGTPKSPLRDDQSLLEVLGSDERGTTFLAKENLLADSFEIAVPLRIYGAIGVDVGAVETEPLEV
jgi:glutamate 5-kinase